MKQVVQARSPGLMELNIVLCLPSLCSGQCFLGKTRMKLGLVCGSRKAMVQEAEVPRRWGKLVPSNEKKGVELQGPVTSSDIVNRFVPWDNWQVDILVSCQVHE